MSRFSRYDTDEERLPDGMTRVGYDADTEVYAFEDADGSLWESAPGCRYGQLTCVSRGAADVDDEDAQSDAQPFLEYQDTTYGKTPWRQELQPLINFGMLICLCLLGLFWYLHYSTSSPKEPALEACAGDGQTSYAIRDGDTCWSIADEKGLSVGDMEAMNPELHCDELMIGGIICLPET